jgi:hypothetical protein
MAESSSSSPERNTLFTPVNGDFDDRYTQVMGQYPFLSPTFGYGDEALHVSPEMRKLGSGLSPSAYPSMAFTSNAAYMDYLKSESAKSKQQSQPRVLEDWTAASTRFLKLVGIQKSVSSTALFQYLQVCSPQIPFQI